MAEPLLATYGDKVARLRAPDGTPDGVVETHVFERAVDELEWLAGAVHSVHDAGTPWAEIGVLSRDNAQAEEVYDALTGAGIPVEIVGLSGLIRLPEVAEVVATLSLLHDVTANTAVLTLLAGPRWAIGPRDLRLLAERASEIGGGRDRGEAASIAQQLLRIADGIDVSELPALSDALADPGDAPYSPEARERFGLLAGELRRLRAHVGDPLLDVVRRVIDTTGVDVELASATAPAAAARRDNLDLFVKAVAEFQSVDGDVTLPALLAYLTAEDDQGNGLDIATPTAADSVKLLTVHRAKGLEWSSVFCVGVGETRFPSNRSRTLWTSSPAVLPAPLRGDRARPATAARLRQGGARRLPRRHPRARRRGGAAAGLRRLHPRRPPPRRHVLRLGPARDTVRTVRLPAGRARAARGVGRAGRRAGSTSRAAKPPNPNDEIDPSRPWPVPGPGEEARRRLAAAELVRASDPTAPDEGLDLVESARVADWDDDLGQLLAEARAARATDIAVPLPSSLSATGSGPAARRPRRARSRARPADAAPAVAPGPLRHRLPRLGRGALRTAGADRARRPVGPRRRRHRRRRRAAGRDRAASRRALRRPCALRRRGAVRARAGRAGGPGPDRRGLPRGRRVVPDRRLEDQPGRDRRPAPARDLPPGVGRDPRRAARRRVRAAFHYVRTGRTVEPDDLPGRDELEALVTG